MKKYELDAIETNLIKTLEINPIGRNEELFDFMRFLDNVDGCVKISLDADWGDGKTFFVRQSALLLKHLRDIEFGINSSNENSNIMSNVVKDKISLNQTFIPVYYDAWLSDEHQDPILSLVFNLVVNGYVGNDETKKERLLKKASVFCESFLKLKGVNLDFEKLMDSSDELNSIYSTEYNTRLLGRLCEEIIVENCDKLIFFVDELDRCKPDYAIKLLERVKHFFNDERIIFVFSTNKAQLIHTIKNYYGAEFNATAYLNRFFEYQFTLEKINVDKYLNFIDNSRNPCLSCQYIVIAIGNYYKFSMREYNIYYSKFKTMGSLCTTKAYAICFNVLAPIVWALSLTNTTNGREFTSGNLLSELEKVLAEVIELRNYAFKMMPFTKTDSEKLEVLYRLYTYMFTPDNGEHFTSPDFDVTSYDKQYILKKIRMA